jgi:hypothetical protein
MDLSSGSELRRVRLEPARYQSPDDESEVESDVTAEDPNFEAEYEVGECGPGYERCSRPTPCGI